MSWLWRSLALALISLQLSGCALGLLGSGKAPTTYDLTAVPSARNLGRTGAQLAIREPRAVQVLDSQSIVFRPSPVLVTYYSNAQWSDRLPKLVEARVVEAFEVAGKVRTITRTTDGLTVDYQLLTEVRDFSVSDSPSGQTARVAIYATLIADTEGRAVTGKLFEAQVPVSGDGAEAGVAAMNEALAQVLTGMVRWTLTRI